MKSLLFVFIFLTLFFVLTCTSEIHNSHNEKVQLTSTLIAPYLDYPIEKQKNLLFCATFQIAWNGLKENIVKDDIILTHETEMVGHLNSGVFSKDDLSKRDYVALSGFGKDGILEKINSELKKKFKDKAPAVEEDTEDSDIIVYSFLYKNLRFITKFEDHKIPLFFSPNGEGADVQSFGIKKYFLKDHKDIGKQVVILSYVDDLDFILSLSSDSPYDEIILAMVEPEKTLLETIEKVNDRIEDGEPSTLVDDDVLKIPKICFDINHSYDDLVNKYFKNKNFSEYFIAKAIQNIKFQLDQKGAILESEAEILLKKNGGDERYLVFSQPFLLMLREKGRMYPYLAIWINNPELFEKYEKKE